MTILTSDVCKKKAVELFSMQEHEHIFPEIYSFASTVNRVRTETFFCTVVGRDEKKEIQV